MFNLIFKRKILSATDNRRVYRIRIRELWREHASDILKGLSDGVKASGDDYEKIIKHSINYEYNQAFIVGFITKLQGGIKDNPISIARSIEDLKYKTANYLAELEYSMDKAAQTPTGDYPIV